MSELKWNVGDWAIFDLKIVQITEIREGNASSVSDGTFQTSGMLLKRLRPLTLRNKRIAEYFESYYRRLSDIRGERGFNYPDISSHFAELAIKTMDGDANDQTNFNAVEDFVQKARDYIPVIQGIHLFRAT